MTIGSYDSAGSADVSYNPRRIAVNVTHDALRQIRGGHPWVFDQSVTKVKPPKGVGVEALEAGDLAVIFDDRNKFAAIGLYDPLSPVRVRVLHHGSPIRVDNGFFIQRLGSAIDRRVGRFDETITNGFRLVHGENDHLPGLVVDRFADHVVIKVYTAAWLPFVPLLAPLIVEALTTRGLDVRSVVLRSARSVSQARSQLHVRSESSGRSVSNSGSDRDWSPALSDRSMGDGSILYGMPPDGPVVFKENGLRFEADVLHGHKTGFFLDQRDNRHLVRTLASGARVLDVFSYSGGFSVSAAAGGAVSVHSVDVSPAAIEVLGRNVALNRRIRSVRSCNFDKTVGDAYKVMDDLRRQRRLFDLVILDPPSFASNKAQVQAALRAYGELTKRASELLAPGGSLFQASCSARIDRVALAQAVLRGADRAGVDLRIENETAQPFDHPIGFPQGAYLNALVAKAR